MNLTSVITAAVCFEDFCGMYTDYTLVSVLGSSLHYRTGASHTIHWEVVFNLGLPNAQNIRQLMARESELDFGVNFRGLSHGFLRYVH